MGRLGLKTATVAISHSNMKLTDFFRGPHTVKVAIGGLKRQYGTEETIMQDEDLKSVAALVISYSKLKK